MEPRFLVDGRVFSRDEMLVDPGVATMIFSVHSQYSDQVLNSLAESLKERGYAVRSSLKDGTVLSAMIFSGGRRAGTIDSHYVWLVANASLQLCDDIAGILRDSFGYFRHIVGRVPHVEKEEVVSGRVSVRTASGIVESPDRGVPLSVFLLYEGESLIGRALVDYFNPEMGEYEPTVVSIQVSREGQGRAGILLGHMEGELGRNGFVKLWVRDVQNEGFWRGAGYQIDGGQGVKYLNPPADGAGRQDHGGGR